MKFFLLLIAGILLWAQAASAQTAQTYFRALPDIPAAPGLVEIEAQGVSFEKPEGRIAEAVAAIKKGTPPADTVHFYEAALPPLGWVQSGKGIFRRDNEVLTLRTEYTGGQALMRFEVGPAH